MRKTFRGYYRPTKEEFSLLWKECVFVLDANVLLNLYRYTTHTRKQLMNILNKVSNRLWVPHQAALEYHSRRADVITQQAKAYDKVLKLYADFSKTLENDLRSFSRHPSIDVKDLTAKTVAALAAIEDDIRNQKRAHPNLHENDPLLDEITKLLEGKVGETYTFEQLQNIEKIAAARFMLQIPPGFKDANKKENSYGDLVLWLQTIEYAKIAKKPIILITDDSKDDWWLRREGRTIGPRPELIQEMSFEAKVGFYSYQVDQFMQMSKNYLKQQVKPEAIKEVRDIRKSGEDERAIAITGTIPAFASQLAMAQKIAHSIPWEHLAAAQSIADSIPSWGRLAAAQRIIADSIPSWEHLAAAQRTADSIPWQHVRSAQMAKEFDDPKTASEKPPPDSAPG